MPKKNSNINEQRTAAASYIINFYQQTQDLVDYFVSYTNILTEIKYKYKGIDLSKIEDNDKQTLLVSSQNLRYCIQKIFIQYKTILHTLNKKENKKLTQNYNQIKEHFIMQQSKVENFVIDINIFLMEDIIKQLISSSQELITDIYDTK